MEKTTKTFNLIITITITVTFLLFFLTVSLINQREVLDSKAKSNKKIRNLYADTKDLRTITIVKLPKKLSYKEGELLDTKGMVINALYSDGTKIEIDDYTIDKKKPLTIYDSKVTISYKGKTATFSISIENNEGEEIYPNTSKEKYTVELKEDKITRFEIEDSDLSEWKISDEDDEDLNKKIIKNDTASRKAYLSGVDKNIIEGRKLMVNLDLNFNAKIEMSVSYFQNQISKNYDIGIISVYNFIINENKNIGINGESLLKEKKKWQIIKYKEFSLPKGKHTLEIKITTDTKYGTPHIDYIDFKSEKIDEIPIEPDIDEVPSNDFHTLLQYLYINDDPLSILNYANGVEDLSRPKGNLLDFSDDIEESSDEYIIQISSSKYFNSSDTKTIEKLKKPQYTIKNLKLGQTIFYRGGINKDDLKKSKIYELKVNTLAPRNVDIPGVDNARDIGGVKSYLVEDGVIKQGLYFRSARTDHIKDDGQIIVTKDLGIKVEIDLRGKSEAKGPYIDGVKYYSIPIDSGSGKSKFNDFEDEYYKVFDLISKADEKPIILHCSAGADRTGIMTFALMTLLGCERNDVFRNYLFTNFAAQKIREVNSDITIGWKNLDSFKGETKAEQCKNWLMTKNIEEDKLEHIREIFIENYKAKKK